MKGHRLLEVTRAKKAILHVYTESDRAHWSSRLVEAALDALGAPSQAAPMELRFPGPIDPSIVTKEHPTISQIRGCIAARIAIAELAADGSLLSSTGPPTEVEERRDALMQSPTIRVQHAGGGGSMPGFELDLVEVALAYQRSRLGDRPWANVGVGLNSLQVGVWRSHAPMLAPGNRPRHQHGRHHGFSLPRPRWLMVKGKLSHVMLTERARPMRGLKRDRTAKVIVAGHAFVQNLRRGFYDLGTDVPSSLRLADAFAELALII